MTELRALRQFAMLAEELHFGRAAARLHMTQPPLTMALRSLEARLGVRLLDRSQRKVALSDVGAALLPAVTRLLALADELPRLAQAAAEGHSGELRLAFVSSIAYGPLPGWLRAFRTECPQVRLDLREATLDVQLKAFEQGEIDAGFVLHAPGERPPHLQHCLALSEPLVLALPEGHPLAARRSLSFKQVAHLPLLVFPRHIAPSLFDALMGAYRRHGVTPVVAQEAIQMQTLINLVSAGIGVAWAPASLMQLQRPGVVYRRVRDAELRCETSLVWPTSAGAVVRRFVQVTQLQQRQSAPRATPPKPHKPLAARHTGVP